MSKITNLIGTTWRLGGVNVSGLPAEYGIFNVNTDGNFYMVDNPSLTYIFTSSLIACGYYSPPGSSQSGVISQSGSFCVEINSIESDGEIHGDLALYYSSSFDGVPFVYEFTITGGDDISNPLFIDFINTYGTLVSGGEPPTAEGVKSKLQSLITASNAKTGKTDANLTDAVNTLLEGYGQGGGGEVEFNIAYGETEPTDTSKLWVKTSEPGAVQVTTRSVSVNEHFESVAETLPTAAFDIVSAAVGTKVYLFGGYGSSNLNTINVFDTENKTITTLDTTLPTAMYNIASAVVGTKVYLFGGQGGDYYNTINVFDTVNNTITTLSTKLPKAAYRIASAVVGMKVYLFGGGNSGGKLATINVFDTDSNTITTLGTTLPIAMYNIASAVVGTTVYLFGGYGSSALNTINAFVVGLALTANHLLINVSNNTNTFNLLPNVELGVNSVYLGNASGAGELVEAALYKDGAWAEI